MVKLSYLLELRVVFLLMSFVGLLPNLNSCLSIIDHHIVPKVERPAADTHKVRPVKSLLEEFPHSSILRASDFSAILLICLFLLVLECHLICRSPPHLDCLFFLWVSRKPSSSAAFLFVILFCHSFLWVFRKPSSSAE